MRSRIVSDSSTVTLGSWVTVRAGELQEAWRVVDPAEADAARRLISADCPLGRALLGHRAGDQVRVDSPDGRWPLTILAVE
jgi:transcription elongation factor GreA